MDPVSQLFMAFGCCGHPFAVAIISSAHVARIALVIITVAASDELDTSQVASDWVRCKADAGCAGMGAGGEREVKRVRRGSGEEVGDATTGSEKGATGDETDSGREGLLTWLHDSVSSGIRQCAAQSEVWCSGWEGRESGDSETGQAQSRRT